MPFPLTQLPSPLNPSTGPDQNDPTSFMKSILDAQGRQQVWDAMGGFAQGLLKASAPSREPMDLGTVFGSGIAGALEGSKGGEDRGIKRAMTGMQLAQMSQEMESMKGLRSLLNGGPMGGSSGAAPPPGAIERGSWGTPSAQPAQAPGMPQARTPGVPSRPGPGSMQGAPNAAPGQPQAAPGAPSPPGIQGAVLKFVSFANANPSIPLGQFIKQQTGPDADVHINTLNGLGLDPDAPVIEFAKDPTSLKMVLEGIPGLADKIGAPQVHPPAQGGGAPQAVGQPSVVPPQAGPGAPSGAPPTAAPPSAGAPSGQPKTLPELVATIPPGVRALMATSKKPSDIIAMMMPYADPKAKPVFDLQANRLTFVPEHDALSNPNRYVPAEQGRLAIEVQKLALEAQKVASGIKRDESQNFNQPLLPNGQPNPAFIGSQGDIEAAKEAAKRKVELDTAGPIELVKSAVKDFVDKERPKGMAIQETIPQLHNIRRQIEAGAITGTGAEFRNALMQFAVTAGLSRDTAASMETPALFGALAAQITANAKALGVNPSNRDAEIVKQAMGANPDVSAAALLKILDVNENIQRQGHARYSAEADRIMKLRGVREAYGDEYFKIPPPPTYDQWKKANPLPGSAPPAAGGPPAPPPGFKRLQ